LEQGESSEILDPGTRSFGISFSWPSFAHANEQRLMIDNKTALNDKRNLFLFSMDAPKKN
jgi:hypothetical protein